MDDVKRKELAKYLADYVETEISRAEPMGGTYDTDDYRVWLDDGIDAFESTTEQTVTVK